MVEFLADVMRSIRTVVLYDDGTCQLVEGQIESGSSYECVLRVAVLDKEPNSYASNTVPAPLKRLLHFLLSDPPL